MKLKRLLAAFGAVLLIVCLGSPVLADEDTPTLEEQLIWACTYREKVDISDHKIKIGTLQTVFDTLYNSGQLPWYCDSSYTYEYNLDTGILTSFTPMLFKVSEKDIPSYEEKAAQVLQTCIKPGMSQYQIALALHDYLALNAAYDSSLTKHSPHDLLVGGSAVCSGYALAYQDLLRRVGIECQYVSSVAMDHAWNVVKIDGMWYHVDVTWDDPTPNTEGMVRHLYFLRTDAEMSAGEKPHYDWNSTTACTDTRFSDAFWCDVESAIWYEDASTCYLVRSDKLKNSVYRRQESSGRETLLHQEADNSSVEMEDGRYFFSHHGLTLRDGRLWFNTLDKVLSMKTDGSDLQTIYENSGKTYLYGSFADEEQLRVTRSTQDGSTSLLTLDLEPTGAHQCDFTRTEIAPTEDESGYTLSVCSGCGLEVKSLPTPALGAEEEHDDEDTSDKKPSLLDPEEDDDEDFTINPVVLGGAVCLLVFSLIGRIFRKK